MYRFLYILLWCPAAVLAQDLPWIERGPNNQHSAIIMAATAPGEAGKTTWYAGAKGGGLWRTYDRGEHWHPLGQDLPNLIASDLAIAHDNPAVHYLSTGAGAGSSEGLGVYRSDDDGRTWTALPFTTEHPAFREGVSLLTDDTGQRVVAGVIGGVYRSDDFGQTWTQVLDTTAVEVALYTHPEAFDVQFAVVTIKRYVPGRPDDSGRARQALYRSGDAGQTWTQVHTEGEHADVTIMRTHPHIVFAGVDRTGWRSSDHGQTWTELAGEYSPALVSHPYSPDTLIRALSTGGYVYDPGPPPRASKTWGDAGGRWDYSVVVPAAPPGQWYWLSPDDGKLEIRFRVSMRAARNYGQFEPWHLGLNTAVVYDVCKRAGYNSYVAVLNSSQNNKELAASWNSREEWDHADATRGWRVTREAHVDFNDASRREVLCHPTDPTRALATGRTKGFLRSPTGGLGWVPVRLPETGNMQVSARSLVNSPARPERVYASLEVRDQPDLSGIWRSDDFGQTWTQVLFTKVWRGYVRVSPADPDVLWSYSSEARSRVISTDGGNTWTERDAWTDQGGRPVLHPTEPGTAYTAWTRYRESRSSVPSPWPRDHMGLYETTDYGQTWARLGTESADPRDYNSPALAPIYASRIYALFIWPDNPNRMWAGTHNGIWESTDRGQTWAHANRGLPATPVSTIELQDGQIVLGTMGRGVWTLDASAVITSAESGVVPEQPVAITGNWPNPFTGSTEITFTLPAAGDASVRVYDVLGRRVAELTGGWRSAGDHAVRWDARGVAGGVYLVRLETPQGAAVHQVVLMR